MNKTSLVKWEEEGVPPLLYVVMGIWANLCIFSE
jgi:hypothetical protein